jgi:hypothetical protein
MFKGDPLVSPCYGEENYSRMFCALVFCRIYQDRNPDQGRIS